MPLIPMSISDIQSSITAHVKTIIPDMLIKVWQQLGLPSGWLPYNQGFTHQTFVGMFHLCSYGFISTNVCNSVQYIYNINIFQTTHLVHLVFMCVKLYVLVNCFNITLICGRVLFQNS